MSLLERAKGINVSQTYKTKADDDKLELAVAWFKGQVSTSQVFKTLGFTNGSTVPSRMALWIRDGYCQGKINIFKTNKYHQAEDEEHNDR